MTFNYEDTMSEHIALKKKGNNFVAKWKYFKDDKLEFSKYANDWELISAENEYVEENERLPHCVIVKLEFADVVHDEGEGHKVKYYYSATINLQEKYKFFAADKPKNSGKFE